MKILALLIAVTFIVGASRVSAQKGKIPGNRSAVPAKAESPWEGSYTFQEGGGRGAFIEHTIKVYRQGESLIADVDAAGFQTSASLRCEARVAGEKISFYFRSYREENIGESYRPGQFLLSLERLRTGGRTRLITNWGAYRPVFRAARNGRVYFTRSN